MGPYSWLFTGFTGFTTVLTALHCTVLLDPAAKMVLSCQTVRNVSY